MFKKFILTRAHVEFIAHQLELLHRNKFDYSVILNSINDSSLIQSKLQKYNVARVSRAVNK